MAQDREKAPCIYVVATPIGNLSDVSERCKDILKSVDFIAAEDTRTTQKILNHLGIQNKRLISYHDHNENKVSELLINEIMRDQLTLALVSDAGTPCISDPGYTLIRSAQLNNIKVTPIPGPSALTTFLSASGLRTIPFTFVGFLPSKTNQKTKLLQDWSTRPGTLVFFESPHRLIDTLELLAHLFPDNLVSLGRELTKIYEEVITNTASKLLQEFSQRHAVKGECVLGIEFHDSKPEISHTEKDALSIEFMSKAKLLLEKGDPTKSLVTDYRKKGLEKQELFKLLNDLKTELKI